MKQGTTFARQRGRGVIATILFALALGGGLIYGLYWWSTRPAAEVPTASVAAAATAAADAVAPAPSGDPARRADAAMREKRMFAPPRDNAFELYLQVLDADPGHATARSALDDLFPYALLYIEERMAAGDVTDADRMLGLMRRADPGAPALPRLADALAELRARQAQPEAELSADSRASSTGATPPVVSTPPAIPSVTKETHPSAPSAVASSAPPRRAAAIAAEPPPAAVPPPVTPAATATAADALPRVVSSAQPRYPAIAMRRKLEGQVELSFTVLPDGSVGEVQVLSSEPDGVFDRAAIAAMERWRFAPQQAETRGRRVFSFRLN